MIDMQNCKKIYEQFDPLAPDSPMISYWNYDSSCKPIYAVDPTQIDSDPVMNKLLNSPGIAKDILRDIYMSMKQSGKLSSLKRTRLGRFYNSTYFKSWL
jgi:hypothetical protein